MPRCPSSCLGDHQQQQHHHPPADPPTPTPVQPPPGPTPGPPTPLPTPTRTPPRSPGSGLGSLTWARVTRSPPWAWSLNWRMPSMRKSPPGIPVGLPGALGLACRGAALLWTSQAFLQVTFVSKLLCKLLCKLIFDPGRAVPLDVTSATLAFVSNYAPVT